MSIRVADSLPLAVERRRDAQRCSVAGQLVDRDEVHAAGLAAVHGKEVDLTTVVPLTLLLVWVVVVRARSSELDRPAPDPPGLALNAEECRAIVDDRSYRVFSPKGTEIRYPASWRANITARVDLSPTNFGCSILQV
jgi:hypothetical protein